MTKGPRRLCAAALALGLLASGCTSGGDGADAADGAGGGSADVDGLPAAEVTVIPGTQEVTITGIEPATPVTLLDEDGTRLLTLVSDDAGQVHTAYLPAEHTTLETGGENILPTGDGTAMAPGTYRAVVDEGGDEAVTDEFVVTGIDDHPDEALYEEQELDGVPIGVLGALPEGVEAEDGFGYLEMRDGTLLSAMVRFPDPAVYGEGPYPTVVEYSGYDAISNPDGEQPGSLIARALGFATVGVAMRGTGCSGGAFDVFSASQQADAYDVIEIVGRQEWAKGGKVGMVGLSYSGITQLYTAATNPPHLAAISPQSVIVDPWLQQWPGGVYNTGFTRQWLGERDAQAANGGVGWVSERAEGDDEVCADNLVLRSQNVDFESLGRSLENRPPDAGGRDLRELVRQIDVPVYLTGAFQDEQTGPLFTGIVDRFDEAPLLRTSMWNGRHPDGYSPMNTMEWFEFLSLYVADEVPRLEPLIRAGLPAELASNFGLDDVTLGPDRLAEQFGDDLDAARDFYEAEQPVRVVFESGAGENEPGEPGGTFELRFDTWPTPEATTRTWYLGAEGLLADEAPAGDALPDTGHDAYRHDPGAGDEDFFGEAGYELLVPQWDVEWTQFPDTRSLSYVTEPLEEDLVLGGPGELALWFGSDATDADVQVTLTEVRPDDTEVLLQSGWLRMSHRAVDEATTDGLRVEHTYTEQDREPLDPGEVVEARMAIPSVAAPLRAGSRLRVQIATPGRNHGTWLFESLYPEGDEPIHRVAHTADMPSAITLSVLPGVEVPPGIAACGVLRGQPCRPYEPTTNASPEQLD